MLGGRLGAVFWTSLLFGAVCDIDIAAIVADESLRIDITHPKQNQQLTDIVRSCIDQRQTRLSPREYSGACRICL
jgi:hypothetical protein